MIHKIIEEIKPPFEETAKTLFQGRESLISQLSGGKGIFLGVAIGVTITLVGNHFLSSSQKAQKNPTPAVPVVASKSSAALSVTITEVKTFPVNLTLKATGTVFAFEPISVLSQATGLQIQQVLVDEGDFVKAGQVLATLDDSVQQARLLQAKAMVAQAEARLAELKAGTRTEEIARARETVKMVQADLIQAKLDWDLAKKRLQRNQNLEAEGAIALDRLDEFLNLEHTKKSIVQQTQARLREAQQKLQELEAGPRREVIAQAMAQLAESKAQLQIVLAQLKDTKIISPVSGKIAQRNARVGDVTAPSQSLFTIIENGRLELQVKLPETDLPSIRLGQQVAISSDANTKIELAGSIREIVPTVDQQSRQATLKIDLPTQSGLKPGMFLRAAIVTSTANSLTIPMGAVLPQTEGNALVYVLQAEQIVKAQPVILGEILANEKVEIVKGLNIGDRIVVKGAAYLKDGDKVAVISQQ